MKKVVARITGGLGNQLFVYAAARRLALANNAELVLDNVSGFVRDHRYRRQYVLDHFHIAGRAATPMERFEPVERPRRAFARARSRWRPFGLRSYVTQEGPDFDPRLLDYKVRRRVYLDGIWASEGYFKDVESTLRKDLQIKAPTDAANVELAERIRGLPETVAVHVRWFQDPTTQSHQNAPIDYYERALSRMNGELSDPWFVLFSDKPLVAQAHLPLPEDRTLVVSHNDEHSAYADLWLMTQCRHFITANSTFSWWGAWLGDHPDKTILSPSAHTVPHSNWAIKGLIPSSWTQL